MDEFRWDVSSNLGSLLSAVAEPALISTCRELLAKQIWGPQDRQQLLSTLSKYFLYPQCTLPVAEAFRPILLDVLERAGQAVVTRGRFCLQEHERLCVAVGKVLDLHPDVFRFLMKYLQTAPPVFERLLSGKVTVKVKKKKKQKHKADDPTPPPSLTDILATCHRYLRYSREAFVDLWDWSPVMKLVAHEDIDVRWYSLQIAATLTDMADQPIQALLTNHFTPDDLRLLTLGHEEAKQLEATRRSASLLLNSDVTFDLERREKATHTMRELVGADLSPSVAAVCGVLLPVKAGHEKKDTSHTMVRVPSTARNLHSLALAVSSGTAVLLEGAVGCGKSALVDHLAQVTGRRKTPDLLKVQLGDQTDSKALIGTYRCTDIPGEFVWQPGALTQAVTNGHWILLEDIDYAPMDVISVLVPLLEAGSLSLPGHGDVVRAAPGFQLFATQRLTAGAGGFFRQHVSHAALLDRMWSKVNVEPLSREELQQVVVTLHPKLTSVVDKLLDIFIMLSSGSHDDPQETKPDEQHGRVVTPAEVTGHQGRLISTRDLLKWCGRIAARIDGRIATNPANNVFLEALDCFCAALPKPKTRASVAEAVGVRLNLSLEKCGFFVNSYKPNIDIQQEYVTMGRARLTRKEEERIKIQRSQLSNFAFTRPASVLLERVAVCISNNEPVLLVGETGTGKTSSVQYLADLTGRRLKVVNMNQQSDSTDLLGGFKPVDFRQLISPVRESFETLFVETFSRKQNVKFLMHLQECFTAQRWQDLLKLMGHCHQAAVKRFEKESHDEEAGSSSGKQSPTMRCQWRSIGERIQLLKTQLQHSENALAFSFVEGTLVQAVRNGDWVLLDEINLATAETLECLSGLLESTEGTVTLLERGDSEPIVRHKDFRLFACMNPATDVGKKELPPGIRNRFTEFFVDELEETQDLKILVSNYLRGLALPPDKLDGIVQFYLAVRKEAEMKLADGTGHRPHYSLRTLCRALRYASTNPCGSVMRSLYESFCLSFLTQLDRASHPLVEQLVCKKLIGRANMKGVLGHPIPPPAAGSYVKMEGYWIATGEREPEKQKGYVMTPSVKANLRDLARIVSAGSFPVLLQGETSVGKTSLIHYLAMATGNHCVRVNNHEHTDLQEYVGFYAADEMGKLVFKEGVLVDAMRKGHWIILDELNLAPSDVLEALNRLLDDNRELYIPETQEMISAHPRFMLFATQNPPGQYGGRKVLSRAFRNRFVELHFDEIPSKELETILHQRCAIPLSYCKKMVAVMLDLQTRRKGSGVFSGKQGFITLRDLFRWAERYRRASQGQGTLYDWDQHIADDGYLLLAGRVRRPKEQSLIKEVLEKHIRCKIDPARLFSLSPDTSPITRGILERVLGGETPEGFGHVVWTFGMRRLAVLVGQALKFQEPVLLVGETGCGKTTICQLHAALANQKLYTVNCHLHTETSDFLGGLRPVRQHSSDKDEDKQKLFEWCDGPLVLAMREDAAFLIDEISLADDSVLERLNSVLEPERTLLLAERGSGESTADDIDVIVAGEQFFVVATMNPGGDFGKKELSPALRNRFTEIWCPQSNDRQDLVHIIEHNLAEGVWLCNQEDGSSGVGNAIMEFVSWFQNSEAGKRCTVSIRDILSWVNFINTCCDASTSKQQQTQSTTECLDTALAYVHGACMVFLDGLGSGSTSNTSLTPHQARHLSLNFLRDQVWRLVGQDVDLTSLMVTSEVKGSEGVKVVDSKDGLFGIEPFYIPRGPLQSTLAQDHYALNAPTTALNAQRVLRALQLPRAILLEGSPGVGKTSLVSAIAKASGHELVRINLSEQTDVTDLFGADLPVEGGEGGQFAWRDGPLLRALKGGHWIVLDELNLASQSVLEGLNACLDHRAEVYVPELGKTFHIQHEKTRLFACQNPLKQGGGRKGLPRSFLNRFTQVYVEPLTAGDLLFIAHTMYPMLTTQLLEKMVAFNNQLYQETMVEYQWGQRGGPWEFNLRDLFRWCDLMVHDQHGQWQPGQHVGLIYRDRMRSQRDKQKVQELFKSVFGDDFAEAYEGSRQVHITPASIQVGHSFLRRNDHIPSTQQSLKMPLQLLPHCLDPMEALMKCVEMNWMTILVGPSASGKTSLVHLLGHLTGHMVRVLAMNSAMDTTELLGGFEQADLNRHWEQALQSLRHVVMATERLLLLDESEEVSQHAPQLLANWAGLNTMCQTGSQRESSSSTKQSIEGLSERKLDMFEQVLDQVQSVVQKHASETDINEKVGHVTNMAAQLRTRLEKEGRTIQQGGGGKFEWVDGLLVQALKNGDWLLIDNVNFCSPSVLDRLNALLEPNGVLSINERGVIDGHIPTVKPHPDFRLFLAMDPRHGEISRAMRNRGVEVYIVGENEGGAYDRLDLLALLNGIGLTGDKTAGTLLGLHEDIKLNMPGSDVASLPSILLAASVAVQLLERGRDVNSALKQACTDVFVRGQLSKVNKQKAKEIVEKHLSGMGTDLDQLVPIDPNGLLHAEADDDVSIEGALHPRHLPSVDELSRNASWAMLRREFALLACLLSGVKNQAERQSIVRLFRPATLLLLEQATPTDWELRGDWLATTWTKAQREVDDRTALIRTGGAGFVACMPEIAVEALKVVFQHPLRKRLAELLEKLELSEECKMLQHYPLDLNLAPQLLDKLAKLSQKRAPDRMAVDDEQDEEETDAGCSVLEEATAIARRLHLLLRITVLRHIEYSRLRQAVDVKHTPTTAIQLSYALHLGLISIDDLPHPLLAHLYPFFRSLDAFMADAISTGKSNLSEDTTYEILLALHWRDRCWQVCDRPIKGSDSFHLGQFALHWAWMTKKLIAVVTHLLLGNDNALPQDLQTVTNRITDHLASIATTLSAPQHQRALVHHMGQPLPYKSSLCAETSEHLYKLCQTVDIMGSVARVDVGRLDNRKRKKLQRCVMFAVKDGSFACRKIIDLLVAVSQLNNQAVDFIEDDLLDSIQAVEANLASHGLYHQDGNQHIPMETEDDVSQSEESGAKTDVASKIGLWPLWDHVALCAEQTVNCNLLARKMKRETQ
ncbi:midasin-like [Patiria miniata]|uniref:Midasin n=1 Tax=Patiria miniata TaxID=46514 RepID=A0A914A7X0_PATMI|nr:midasin-like [Patiria miniata]